MSNSEDTISDALAGDEGATVAVSALDEKENSVEEIQPSAVAPKKKLSNLELLDQMPVINRDVQFRNNDKYKGKLVLGAVTGERTSYGEGIALQVRGTVNTGDQACSKCASGGGPFADCVSLPELFGGGCAGCQYNSHASTCSLRHHKSAPTRKRTASAMTGVETTEPPRYRRAKELGDLRKMLLQMLNQVSKMEEEEY